MSSIVKVGMIGVSEGNGHPYSFSSIINGYSDEGLAKSGWDGIYNYVRIRDRSEFGIQNLRITHVWTQDKEQTKKLCDSAFIEKTPDHYEEMIGEIDAVIIARDDFENHKKMAQPFLDAGLPVFLDKPLALDPEELAYFKPFLEKGKLMSCSGLRYAKELDEVRGNLKSYGHLKLIRGTVLFSWEKYGLHMVEAVMSLLDSVPVKVFTLDADFRSVIITMSDGVKVEINAMGNVPKIFRVDVMGEKLISTHEVSDNFSMFRRTLWHFAEMINTKRAVIPWQNTLNMMKILIAGNISAQSGKEIKLTDITI
jgi:hypothetical protein